EGFFKESIKKFKAKKIIFFGRIAPVKNLEVLISVFNKLNNKKLNLEIIGPIERGYERIKNFESDNIKFLEPIHDLKEKIQKLQEVDIFILPSRREAMPQSLIEAMALGKLVIASKTQGAIEIINDNKNGLLFKVGNEKELLKKISWALDKKNFKNIEKIQKQARKKSKEFRWKKLTKSWEEILK
ncbi:MAG: glycosyltransferase family 4 protein, partial [Candidatus Nanoarchaeia archaeon]